MDLARLRAHLLSLPGVVEERPILPEIPVYKVMGRMFAHLAPYETPPRITLKLGPTDGRLARASYRAVRACYPTNQDDWNTVFLDGEVGEEKLLAWIDRSHQRVVDELPARLKKVLAGRRTE